MKTNAPRATKAKRRTRTEIAALKKSLHKILEVDHPQTVRQVYYRAVAAGLIAKTQKEYNNAVKRLLGDMRKAGSLPYSWIADNTRWRMGGNHERGLQSAIRGLAQSYRLSYWRERARCRVEVWCESDAIAGVLLEATYDYCVPVFAVHGFSSLSFTYNAAKSIEAEGVPAHIYYFGDYDPSGLCIAQKVKEALCEHAPNSRITFEIVAVTPDQIEQFDLPGAPPKKTDSRRKNFTGNCVEIETLTSQQIQAMVKHCIEQHINPDDLAELAEQEERDRHQLHTIASQIGGAA